jgi:hypothetical protein
MDSPLTPNRSAPQLSPELRDVRLWHLTDIGRAGMSASVVKQTSVIRLLMSASGLPCSLRVAKGDIITAIVWVLVAISILSDCFY